MKSGELDHLLRSALDIQRIPAPTFSEQERAEYLEEGFIQAGLSEVSMDKMGNVYGRIAGKSEACVVISAHLDSVFPYGTQLDLRREGSLLIGPGIGDNAVALAFLLEMANTLVDSARLNGSVWFAANVREEGLGNLEGMQAVVDRFGEQVNGYIVLEGMGLGHIYHRGLQVQRYRISAETMGGHAWIHAGRESAIHNLIKIGSEVVDLSHSFIGQTSVNIGLIQGGTSINTIASQASFDLDLRSEAPENLLALEQALDSLCDRYQSEELAITKELIGLRPGGEIPPDHPLVLLACEALKAGEVNECLLGIASTDANVPLSRGYPAVCIGLTQGGHAHTTEEYIDTQSIPNGFKALRHLILGTLEQ